MVPRYSTSAILPRGYSAMLKYVDKTLVGLFPTLNLRERAEVSVTFSNIPECYVLSAQLSIADGSTTSDFTLRIPETLSINEIRSRVQPGDYNSLPTASVYVDGNILFQHRITYLAKNIAFGACSYTMRGMSDEIALKDKGSIDFNQPPLDSLWSAQRMISHVITASGANITPVFFFEDFDVLHITDFYSVAYIDMINDLLSGLPIAITYISNGSNTKMYFVDSIHKPRFTHKISGRAVTNLSAAITYIPPIEKEW